MADSNSVQVSFVREVTVGATPSLALAAVPILSGGMAHRQDVQRSQTIKTNAEPSDSKVVGIGGPINYNFEWTAAHYDEFLRGILRSDADWSTAVAVAHTDISAVSGGSQKFVAASSDWTDANIVIGQWIFVAGFTIATNNGWFQVTGTITATDLPVSGGTLVTEAAGDPVTVKGQYLRNGTTQAGYSVQEQFTDLTDKYHRAVGAKLGSMSMDVSNGGILTGAFTFEAPQVTQQTAKAGNGSVTAAATKDEMSEVDAVGSLWIDKAVVSYDIMSLGWQISSALRPRKPLGQSNPSAINMGNVVPSGSLEVYLDNDTWALETNYIAGTLFEIAFDLVQGSDRYLFQFPAVLITAEPGNTPGVDTDRMLSFSWDAQPGALYTGGAEKVMQVCRVAV
jgi:hypothetical protein